MISIEKAQTLVTENTSTLKSHKLPLSQALNCVLAEDLVSPYHLPLFDQSAMDGYAINGNHDTYQVTGVIKAGDDASAVQVRNNEAVRIFTGAMIPKGTKMVVMQEKINFLGSDKITLKEQALSEGMNIRYSGEELKEGDLVLPKGTSMNAAAIGLASTLGISEVEVTKRPVITIIETGSELLQPGDRLSPGKIYASNAVMLQAILNQSGFDCTTTRVSDDLEQTEEAIKNATETSDVVILTGGISVGDYDFVEQALSANEVEQVFYKINQKPGKPMYYGRKENVHVFALPGNPAATLTCYFMYVLPCLKNLSGQKNPVNNVKTAMLNSEFIRKGNRTYLLKGYYNKGVVNILTGQSSAMLSAFVDANCLIKLNGEKTHYSQGDQVECYPL
ncbi:MAG: molybdopterin molybdotransferase MoeA [Crocinitomicaceae bacterium]|nr:molybdopterin molybdotransferase MoeA [Crocinitomicaceae bacterium]